MSVKLLENESNKNGVIIATNTCNIIVSKEFAKSPLTIDVVKFFEDGDSFEPLSIDIDDLYQALYLIEQEELKIIEREMEA